MLYPCSRHLPTGGVPNSTPHLPTPLLGSCLPKGSARTPSPPTTSPESCIIAVMAAVATQRVTLDQALEKLEALGTEKQRAMNRMRGAGDMPQYGVLMGDIRKVAKEIKTDHELGLELWNTGNIDARLLGILLLKPKRLKAEQLEEMVRSVGFTQVYEWLDSYVLRQHQDKETLRQSWERDRNPWRRAPTGA